MPLDGACCKLRRCEPVEARVRSPGVVVDLPCFDDPSGFGKIGEQVLVEAFVAVPRIGRIADVECRTGNHRQLRMKRRNGEFGPNEAVLWSDFPSNFPQLAGKFAESYRRFSAIGTGWPPVVGKISHSGIDAYQAAAFAVRARTAASMTGGHTAFPSSLIRSRRVPTGNTNALWKPIARLSSGTCSIRMVSPSADGETSANRSTVVTVRRGRSRGCQPPPPSVPYAERQFSYTNARGCARASWGISSRQCCDVSDHSTVSRRF